MRELLQRVENEICQRRLLADGQKILVGVSGGADSMVLLHLLNTLAKKYRWKIAVAHFNHQLRGRASVADEQIVRQMATKLRLPFSSGCGDVNASARQLEISVEMAARKLRHEFFGQAARTKKISNVALAHHADDQVELFFLRLLRGAGGEGLAGMKWRSPSPADKKITLIRPLLGCSKIEILAFARAEKIPFRDDATNFSKDFLRNRIRNELLPLLRKHYQQGVDKTILRLMDIAGADAEFVDATARAWLVHGRGFPEFENLPLAVQRKILQQQLLTHGVATDFELVEQLRGTAEKLVSVGTGLSVARVAMGQIRWLKSDDVREKKFNETELKLTLSGRTGQFEFGGEKFLWQIRPQTKFRLPIQSNFGGQPTHREIFDADKIGDEIILRHWRAGDRFQPIGLKSSVKLQDLFVNAKIPAAQRRQLILATTVSGEIFWVQGLRLAETFKLQPGTRRQLFWNWSGAV